MLHLRALAAPKGVFMSHATPSQPSVHPARSLAGLLWAGLAAVPALALLGDAAPGLKADGLGIAMAALTLFVGAVTVTFSLRYMRADGRSRSYFVTIGLLVASVLVTVLSGNLAVMALAWCASGWLLARLIGHGRDWAEARAAARRARLAFVAGDAALIGGLGLLAAEAGSLRLDAVLAAAPAMPQPDVTLAALLLLAAAAARCALPPFAGWLLSSMTAPTPVSALMHAGLVNAGGFLLIRFAPVLEAAPAARIAAVALGLAAALHGLGIMAVRPDVKRALAGSTVSQMGFMVMSCGLGAYAAALWHIAAHGLFKAWLFLGSGSTVGMKPGAERLRAPGIGWVALGAFALGLALILGGESSGSLVPLVLALATAAATFLACLGHAAPARARLALTGLLALLVAGHVGGLELAGMALGPDGPGVLPGWAMALLLSGFLAAWAWQDRQARKGAIAPQLYIHLLNAGAPAPAAKGDA